MTQLVRSTCSAGDLGLISVLGRSPKKGKATHFSILVSEIILMTVTSVLGSESRDPMEEERGEDFPPSEANLGKV